MIYYYKLFLYFLQIRIYIFLFSPHFISLFPFFFLSFIYFRTARKKYANVHAYYLRLRVFQVSRVEWAKTLERFVFFFTDVDTHKIYKDGTGGNIRWGGNEYRSWPIHTSTRSYDPLIPFWFTRRWKCTRRDREKTCQKYKFVVCCRNFHRLRFDTYHTVAEVAGSRDFRDICSRSSPDLWTIFTTYFPSPRIDASDSRRG